MRDTPKWRGGKTGKENPSSTRLAPSRKPTRPGLLRHSNIQQAATGADSELASACAISSWSAATQRAKVLAATSPGAARREPLQASLGFADRDLEASAATATGAAEANAGAAGMWVHLWRSRRHRAIGARCVLAAAGFDVRTSGAAHGPTASQHGKRSSLGRHRRGKREPGTRPPGGAFLSIKHIGATRRDGSLP